MYSLNVHWFTLERRLFLFVVMPGIQKGIDRTRFQVFQPELCRVGHKKNLRFSLPRICLEIFRNCELATQSQTLGVGLMGVEHGGTMPGYVIKV